MAAKRRRGLSDLIGEVGNAPQEAPEEREKTPDADRDARNQDTVSRDAASESKVNEALESRRGGGAEVHVDLAGSGRASAKEEPPELPKYLRLERKEARLRVDQVDSLASLARRVNRRKRSRGGERVTENTLIRVAVDWLLSQEEYVEGATEEEIRRSLRVAGSGARSGPD